MNSHCLRGIIFALAMNVCVGVAILDAHSLQATLGKGYLTLESCNLQIMTSMVLAGHGETVQLQSSCTNRLLVIQHGGELDATNLTFKGRTPPQCGNHTADSPREYCGGVSLQRSTTATLTSCTFRSNTAFKSGGGAISIAEFGAVSLSSCLFSSNTASEEMVQNTHDAGVGSRMGWVTKGVGGAVFLFPSWLGMLLPRDHYDFPFERSLEFDNTVVFFQCTFLSNKAMGAGAVHMGQGKGTFATCAFHSNIAREGQLGGLLSTGGAAAGAFYLSSPNHIDLDDGYVVPSRGSFMNCTLASNTAELGAGIYIHSGSHGSFTSCIFALNTAKAWSTSVMTTIMGMSVMTTTGNGGAVFVPGGLLKYEEGSGFFENCNFKTNTARNLGGAMYMGASFNLWLTSCIFRGNEAYVAGSSLFIAEPFKLHLAGANEFYDHSRAFASPLSVGEGPDLSGIKSCPPRTVPGGDTQVVSRFITINGTFPPFANWSNNFYVCPFLCPPGKAWTGNTNSTSKADQCRDCPPGFYNTFSESATCAACPAGRFANKTEATNPFIDCTECRGPFSCTHGQHLPCAVGHFCDNSKGYMGVQQPCSPGKYQDERGQVACKACPHGQVAARDGTTSCKQCPAAWNVKENKCVTCPAGKINIGQQCKACPNGHVAKTNGATNQTGCEACLPGQFDANDGDISKKTCKDCPQGLYNNELGKGACKKCPPGFVPRGTRQECEDCPVGFFEFEDEPQGKDECKSCSSGQYADERGEAGSCTTCPDGFQAADDHVRCEKCPAGKIASGSPCQACPEGQTADAGGHVCRRCLKNAVKHRGVCVCKDNFFLLIERNASSAPAALLGEGADCALCPLGARCCKSFASARALAGFWRQPEATSFYPCPLEKSCKGERTPEEQSCDDIEARNTTSSLEGCAPGHTGTCCATCIAGNATSMGWVRVGSECKDCSDRPPSGGQRTALMFGLLAGVTIFVSLTLLLCVTEKHVEDVHGMRKTKKDAGDIMSIIETAIPFVQRFAALQIVFPYIALPGFADEVVKLLKLAWVNLSEILAVIEPCQVWTSHFEQLIIGLAALPWLGLVVGLSHVLAVARHALRPKASGKTSNKEERQQPPKTMRLCSSPSLKLWTFGFVAIKILHPSASMPIVASFMCSQLAGDQKRYLRKEYSLECWSFDHGPILVAALIGTVFVVLGTPVSLFFLVIRARAESRRAASDLENARSFKFGLGMSRVEHGLQGARKRMLEHRVLVRNKRTRTLNFFTGKYRPSCWWYFCYEMLMTLFIVAVLAAFEPFPQMQIPLAILAATIQILMPAWLRPYRAALEHTISIAGGATFFIIDILQLARLLASQQQNVLVLTGNAESAMSVEEQLAGLDMIVNATLVLSGTGLTYLIFYAMLKDTRVGISIGRFYAVLKDRSMSCCMRTRNKNRVRVLPSAAATAKKPLRGFQKGGKVESRETRREAALDVLTRMPRRLVVRPRQGILDRVPDQMIVEYVAALEVVVDQLRTLHAVSMQAAWRGHSARQVTRQQTRGPGLGCDGNKSFAGPLSRQRKPPHVAASIRQQRAIVEAENQSSVPGDDDDFEQTEDSTKKVASAASTATRRRLSRPATNVDQVRRLRRQSTFEERQNSLASRFNRRDSMIRRQTSRSELSDKEQSALIMLDHKELEREVQVQRQREYAEEKSKLSQRLAKQKARIIARNTEMRDASDDNRQDVFVKSYHGLV